jgi:hypothetical protein
MTDRRAAWLILALAAAIRLWVVWTQTYVLWVDETFQYLEQGHRLAFGSGLMPWEYQDGIRSWLLPGLAGGLMRLGAVVSDSPLAYLRLIRIGCVLFSLVVVLAALTRGARRDGMTGAIVAGGFCAIWFDLLWFSPAVLTETVAAHLAILALWLDDGPGTPRRWLIVGALLGLAFCLRYQYAPAMLVALLWRHRLSWPAWRWLVLGGAPMVIVAGGMFDWVTLGTPFQSIWLHILRNTVQGISAGMGVEPPGFYLDYLAVSLWPFPLFLCFAVIGAIRAPALGLAALVTLIEFSLVPHKEVRFIYLTIAIAPILIGLGMVELLVLLRTRLDARAVPAGAAGLLILSVLISYVGGTVRLGARWQFDRANMRVFLAAHEASEMCGLAVRDIWLWETGGYTWLNRDAPMFLAADDPGLTLPGTDRKMNLIVINHGRPVPRIDLSRPNASSSRFNYLIANRGDADPGFTELSCFDDAARHEAAPICLFRRAGTCSGD